MIAMGNFMNFVLCILFTLYRSLSEKLQCLQREASVTFIVYSALVELQELHFRVTLLPATIG